MFLATEGVCPGWSQGKALAYIRSHPRYPDPVLEDKPRQLMRLMLRRLKRILLWLQTGWSILGMTLLLLLLVELGLRGVFGLKDLGKPQIPPDPRVVRQVPTAATWLDVHYRELARLSDRWQPYVYFRQRPFVGQTINIDEDGLRATWHPPSGTDETAATSPPLKILMLGGSSLWGYRCPGRSDDSLADRPRTARARHSHPDQEPGGDRLCEHSGADRTRA